MANEKAIAAISRTICGLLEDSCTDPEFSSARFDVYQAANLQNPQMTEGVSVYLYRVTVNGTRRNLPPPAVPGGPRTRPPLPLDLHYLVTAWAKEPLKQQLLLGWAIRVLADSPILPAGVLNHYGPAPDIFRPPEAVELTAENLTLQDEIYIWEVAKSQQQPSMGYVARMVPIESRRELIEAGPVQTRVFEFGGGVR